MLLFSEHLWQVAARHAHLARSTAKLKGQCCEMMAWDVLQANSIAGWHQQRKGKLENKMETYDVLRHCANRFCFMGSPWSSLSCCQQEGCHILVMN